MCRIWDYRCLSIKKRMKINALLTMSLLVGISTFLTSCREDPLLTVDCTAINLPATGGYEKFTINANEEAGTWYISSDQSWVSLSQTLGANNQTITVSAKKNESVEQLSAILTIQSEADTKQITVTQDGGTSTLSVDEYKISFSAGGGTKKIYVTSNVNWEIGCQEDWLTISPSSGFGNQEITLSATANKDSEKQTAVLNVRSKDGNLSQRVDVEMAALNVSLSVSTNSIVFEPNKGDEKHFTITCNADWEVKNFPDWLDVDPAAGNGTKSVTLKTIKSNDSSNVITTTMCVKAGDKTENITVSQEGTFAPDCYVVPVDMVSMCESLVWGYDFGSNVHKVVFRFGQSSSMDVMSDDAILNDIKNNPDYWVERTPEQFRKNGNYFSFYGCTPNIEYTLVSVCFDSNDKLGSILRTKMVTQKDDLYTSPYLGWDSVVGDYDYDANNNVIYRITSTTDVTSAYASSFYTWGVVGTELFESYSATDAIIAWFLKKEINKNPSPHDTFYNGTDRNTIREHLEGPVNTICQLVLPANIYNDKYMQTVNWCKNNKGEFSGIITNIPWNLSAGEEAKRFTQKKSKQKETKETLVQFDPEKLFKDVKVVRIK